MLYALCFAPYGWAGLLPVALAPWLVALLHEESRARALASGVIFGVGFWCISVSWVSHVVTRFGEQPFWMGPVCVFLLALILSQWPAVVALIAVAAFPARSRWRLAAFPVLWMASEHGRAHLYGGFPWNLTADALAWRPVWLQSASLWGAYGVGLLVAACWALLAALVAARSRREVGAGAAALAVLVTATAAFGRWRLSRPRPEGPAVAVAAVQPNIPQHVRDDAASLARQLETVLDWTRRATILSPRLVLLPESALPLEWQRSPALRLRLTDIARSCGCSILFNDIDERPDGRYFNAARLLTPGGLAPATYHKIHLVPFGEYVPLPRLFFFMHRVARGIGDFSAARRPVLLEDRELSVGTAVCYEMTYPSLARQESRQGANLLVSVSNDAWYGRAGAQAQHFAAMVLRAVENGRPFARSAITGISGICDARGRILARMPEDRAGIAFARVRLARGSTAWMRWGVAFPLAADAAVLLLLAAALLRRRP